MGDSPELLPWLRPKRMDKMKAEVKKPEAALWRLLRAHR
jgi:hypothetical protein